MKVTIHKRIPRGWDHIDREITPEVAKKLIEARNAIMAKSFKPCKCYETTDNPNRCCSFHRLKIGQEIAGPVSGTLNEMAQAGIEIE